MYLMMDMVLNHTSTKHEWFQKALKGDPKYRNYYIFKKGKNGLPPTNWVSKFGGNAWSYLPETDEYYLHLFHVTQADLNWENPEVRQDIYDTVNFWLEKGVKGLRFECNQPNSPSRTFMRMIWKGTDIVSIQTDQKSTSIFRS